MRAFSGRLLLGALLLAASAALQLAPSAVAAQPFSVSGSWTGQGTIGPTATPGVFASTDSGRGHATRIGVFALAASELDDFSTGAVTDGAFELTTPSSDTIFGTYSGSFVPLGPTTTAFSTYGQITGGTGRFSGASGPILFTGTASAVTLGITGKFVASLSLPK